MMASSRAKSTVVKERKKPRRSGWGSARASHDRSPDHAPRQGLPSKLPANGRRLSPGDQRRAWETGASSPQGQDRLPRSARRASPSVRAAGTVNPTARPGVEDPEVSSSGGGGNRRRKGDGKEKKAKLSSVSRGTSDGYRPKDKDDLRFLTDIKPPDGDMRNPDITGAWAAGLTDQGIVVVVIRDRVYPDDIIQIQVVLPLDDQPRDMIQYLRETYIVHGNSRRAQQMPRIIIFDYYLKAFTDVLTLIERWEQIKAASLGQSTTCVQSHIKKWRGNAAIHPEAGVQHTLHLFRRAVGLPDDEQGGVQDRALPEPEMEAAALEGVTYRPQNKEEVAWISIPPEPGHGEPQEETGNWVEHEGYEDGLIVITVGSIDFSNDAVQIQIVLPEEVEGAMPLVEYFTRNAFWVHANPDPREWIPDAIVEQLLSSAAGKLNLHCLYSALVWERRKTVAGGGKDTPMFLALEQLATEGVDLDLLAYLREKRPVTVTPPAFPGHPAVGFGTDILESRSTEANYLPHDFTHVGPTTVKNGLDQQLVDLEDYVPFEGHVRLLPPNDFPAPDTEGGDYCVTTHPLRSGATVALVAVWAYPKELCQIQYVPPGLIDAHAHVWFVHETHDRSLWIPESVVQQIFYQIFHQMLRDCYGVGQTVN